MGLHGSGLRSDVDYEHREVLLRDKPEHMLEVSPKGTVPVFITANGTVIDESLDLLEWALGQNDPSGWMDCDVEAAEYLIDRNDTPFKHHLDRYKYASRYKDGAKRGDVDLQHRRQAETYIQTLENRLQANEYLLGSKQSIADIAIFPFIRQFANTDREWWKNSPYPATRHWLAHHVESNLFKAVMTKYQQWSSSDHD